MSEFKVGDRIRKINEKGPKDSTKIILEFLHVDGLDTDLVRIEDLDGNLGHMWVENLALYKRERSYE